LGFRQAQSAEQILAWELSLMSEPGHCRSPATEIEVLVQKGLLNADARNNTRAIREALYQYFDRTLN
jgi:hypothetical protein